MADLISIVVPVYNESGAITSFVTAIDQSLAQCSGLDIEFVFVNDGSTDHTLQTLLACQASDNRFRVIDLSRNFGKESALTAGLMNSRGAAVIPMDIDLQDPPTLIPEMINQWRNGYEVVLARRSHRDTDPWIKRSSAACFYRIHNWLAEPKLPANVGDFRLMDRCVVDALATLPESRRFMKGLFAWLGFKSITLDYARPERQQGHSKFNGWSLWNLAIEGITSFSVAPLRLWTYLGATVSLLSILYACFIAIRVLVRGIDVPGYASIMVAITFLGGIQLIGIGVIGEYLSRTYIESKRRPPYLIKQIYEKTGH